MEDQFLTADEIEEIYGLKPSTLRILRERGIGPKTKEINGKIVYPVKDFERWLSSD